ncbi:cell wall protein DAN4 [Biomphalaria glabrata]|nr:cell wall protein DAN4 [Biomphalaria glabrata]
MIYFKVFLTVFGCYFLIESTESAQINTYVGQDGRSYYYSALACESTSLVSYYLQNIRKSYTSRDEKQCCYLNVTRNSCCLSASGDCRCGPSVTCGVPTTTSTTTTTTSTSQTTTPTTTTTTSTTTTTATTAKPQESLCSLQQRILNGAPLDNGCKYKGLANITLGNFTACHAVLTMATVNGTFKTTFLTTVSCKSIITAGYQFDLQIGELKLPLTSAVFNIINDTSDAVFLELNERFKSLLTLLKPCQSPACPYDVVNMLGKVNLTDCKLVSYGVTNATTFKSNGLNEVSVSMVPNGCKTVPSTSNGNKSLCFKSTSGSGVLCYGDAGAPVYCRAPFNSEWILVGVAQAVSSCGSSEFRVLHYPG